MDRSTEPMLKSEHVGLTHITFADLPILLGWINDREQVLFNSAYKPVNEDQHQEWFESILRRPDVVLYGIRLLKTGTLIGSCQLHNINPVHRHAELQIRLGDPAQRGHGYGTEAVRLLLKFGFNDLNLRRIYLHVFNNNLGAIRAYEKAGFVREGLLRKAAFIDGEYLDVVVMGILHEDYVGQEANSHSPT